MRSAESGGSVRVQRAPAIEIGPSVKTTYTSRNMTMNNAQKALNWAITNSDVDAMVEILSSNSVDVDVDDRDRACGMQTALMRLCHLRISESQRCAVVRLLLNKDPDVNIKDGSGRSALAHACIAERADVVEYLSQVPHCDPAAKDNDGNTPLMHAVRSRKAAFVQHLLRCFYDRLDINARNDKGATALTEAEVRQDTDICRVLVTEGGAVSFPSNPMPASARQTPMSSIPDIRHISSPHLSSRASSTPRRRLEALPPTTLPFRPRGPVADDLLSPRSARPSVSVGLPASLLANDNLSDTSSTVLLSLPQESVRSPSRPRKNARKKESASEFASGQKTSRGQQGTGSRQHRVSNAHLPSIDDAKSESSNHAVRKSVGAERRLPGSTRGDRKPSPDPSQESAPLSLPKITQEPGTPEPDTEADGEQKPPRRRHRKNSASLPNLTNSGPTFLVSSHRGSTSNDNIAGSAAAMAAAAAAAESRALDWERGVRSSYRKENPDFKLPQLNVALNGSLSNTEWCARCGRALGLCGCGIDVDSRGESNTRLSSKGRNRNSGGNGLERMLYLSGDSRIPVRPSRTFTSGD